MATANNGDDINEFDIHLLTSECLIEFRVKWTFKNFSKFPYGTVFKSPVLEPAPECRLIFQKINDDILPTEYFLKVKNESNQKIEVEADVFIYDCDGELCHENETLDTYDPNEEIDILAGEGLHIELLEYKDDIVIFICRLKITKMFDTKCFTMDQYNGVEKLCTDLRILLDDNMHADVTLKVGGARIPANKAILSARSAVFENMFCRNMDEQDNGSVQVNDVSLPVLKKLVEFLYTGELDVETDIATVSALHSAADKFEVLDLRKMCADTLISLISVDNVTEIVVTAYRHEDDYLKTQVLDFLGKNINCIMESEKWNEFVTADSKFAAQVLEYLVTTIEIKSEL